MGFLRHFSKFFLDMLKKTLKKWLQPADIPYMRNIKISIFLLSGPLLFPACSFGPSTFPSRSSPYNNGNYYGSNAQNRGNNPYGNNALGNNNGLSNNSAGNAGAGGPVGAGGSNGYPSGVGGAYSSSAGAITARSKSDLPYDLVIDKISVATCYGLWRLVDGKHWTLEVSAVHQKGLTLNRDFISNNNLSDDSKPGEILEKLNRSPFKNTVVRIGLQDETDPSRTVKIRRDIFSWFPILSNPNTLENLSRAYPEGVFTTRSTHRDQTQGGGIWQAFLPYPSGWELRRRALQLEKSSIGDYLLALKYVLNGKTIYSGERRPYGRGYKLQFNDPYKGDYLVDIHEEDLATTESQGAWECRDDFRFMILRSKSFEDNPFNKMMRPDSAGNPRFKQAEVISQSNLEIAEEGYCHIKNPRDLPGNIRWVFDKTFQRSSWPLKVGTVVVPGKSTNQLCVVPNDNQCHTISHIIGTADMMPRFEYDPEKQDDCTSHPNDIQNVADEKFYKLCPPYLSVCIRRDD